LSASFLFCINLGALFILMGGEMGSPQKTRPAGVPEENEYHSLHWTILLAYILAAGALYLLLTGQ